TQRRAEDEMSEELAHRMKMADLLHELDSEGHLRIRIAQDCKNFVRSRIDPSLKLCEEEPDRKPAMKFQPHTPSAETIGATTAGQKELSWMYFSHNKKNIRGVKNEHNWQREVANLRVPFRPHTMFMDFIAFLNMHPGVLCTAQGSPFAYTDHSLLDIFEPGPTYKVVNGIVWIGFIVRDRGHMVSSRVSDRTTVEALEQQDVVMEHGLPITRAMSAIALQTLFGSRAEWGGEASPGRNGEVYFSPPNIKAGGYATWTDLAGTGWVSSLITEWVAPQRDLGGNKKSDPVTGRDQYLNYRPSRAVMTRLWCAQTHVFNIQLGNCQAAVNQRIRVAETEVLDPLYTEHAGHHGYYPDLVVSPLQMFGARASEYGPADMFRQLSYFDHRNGVTPSTRFRFPYNTHNQYSRG
nr:hypothetical protein [Acidimicrobiales bacterium]